ncbi:MAG: arsenate reductase (glutaredoxin) [Flavobacteriaceae bacterium]
MITIYHNPRCQKSRLGVKALEESGQAFTIVKYLETPLTVEQLKTIVQQLGLSPLGLVRTQEAIWKSDFKGKVLSDEDIIQAMITHPKLMERPIVVNGDKAVIGRPTEEIIKIL